MSTTIIFLICFDLLQEYKVCLKILGSVLWSTLNVVWTTFWSVFCMAGKLQLIPQIVFRLSICTAAQLSCVAGLGLDAVHLPHRCNAGSVLKLCLWSRCASQLEIYLFLRLLNVKSGCVVHAELFHEQLSW